MFMPTPHHAALHALPRSARAEAPFASFEALARTLRDGRRERHTSVWHDSLGRGAEAADQARRAGTCDALVTATLLQQIGALALADPSRDGPLSTPALAHLGADLLIDLYPPLVTESIRLQPAARRYLASGSSSRSNVMPFRRLDRDRAAMLRMNDQERECFAAMPFAMNAVRVCRWTLAAATGTATPEADWTALLRAAERSVCNGGRGWGG